MDLMRHGVSCYKEMRNFCILLLMETWLCNNIPDSVYNIDGLLLFRADQNHLSGKTRGGGLCVYINKGWCTNCSLLSSHCSAAELHNHICVLRNRHPEGFFVVAGHFKYVKLTDILPRFHQHISMVTRGSHMPDFVYTKRREAYRAVPCLHLCFSDHVSILLVPPHHPVLKENKPTVKTIMVWSSGGASMLQDRFDHINWQIFREAYRHRWGGPGGICVICLLLYK